MSLEIFSRKVIFIQHIRTYICSMIIFNARCALVIPKKKEKKNEKNKKSEYWKIGFLLNEIKMNLYFMNIYHLNQKANGLFSRLKKAKFISCNSIDFHGKKCWNCLGSD